MMDSLAAAPSPEMTLAPRKLGKLVTNACQTFASTQMRPQIMTTGRRPKTLEAGTKTKLAYQRVIAATPKRRFTCGRDFRNYKMKISVIGAIASGGMMVTKSIRNWLKLTFDFQRGLQLIGSSRLAVWWGMIISSPE